ncbi:hypothetical protein [Actomonas aquatica]|uniref:Glycosyltransferase RgtA/B/C/D-like domain-containing protein n=1 Tax=Actomonas aquatica TaxID=2866162 RepID=A0ABZ1C9Z6_9BACT|nr:hypothetical protein [Opitutus sp. WL0086]WRQ88511.1 hypothetical protein K1X11_003790 [Opitutus sp. WL0086]
MNALWVQLRRIHPVVTLAALLVLGFFGWGVVRGWSLPVTDSHSSRQAQTAITAQLLQEQGPSPLTPFNGLGPPWSVPMEFPTYQLLTAGFTVVTGGDVVAAGRLVSVLGSLALLPALWLLLGRLNLTANQRVLILCGLLTSSLWVHYSRAVLIETWATALAVWWLAAWVEALHRGTFERRWLFAATALGLVAALTKVTSFAVVLPVAFVLTFVRARAIGRIAWYRSGFCTAPGILAVVWWTHWSDAVKAAHPYADFLTSAALTEWNWGTLAQRLDPVWWQQWWAHADLILPHWTLVLIPVGLALGNRAIRIAIGLCLLAFVTGPLVFANLYYVHDYYHLAVAPFLVVAVGLGLVAIQQRAPQRKLLLPVVALLAVAVWTTSALAYRDGLGRGQMRNRPIPELANRLQELTRPDDVVLLYGREWEPLVTFYAGRRMTAIRGTHETDETAWQASVAALAPDHYTVLVALDSVAGDLAFVHHRCRELGLSTTPLASTGRADFYVSETRRAELAPTVTVLREAGRLLPQRPDRMGPGESRIEFITADWKPVTNADIERLYGPTTPVPDAVFAKYDPAPMQVGEQTVLHIHPPGGLHYAPLSVERTVTLDYGMMPEIWEKERDTDGVRFRAYVRDPDGRDHLIWTDFLQPRRDPTDQGQQSATFTIPAHHAFELRLDAGPDHNPGYDWSYIARLELIP